MVDKNLEDKKYEKLPSQFIQLDCIENDNSVTQKSRIPWSQSFSFEDKKKFLPITEDFKFKSLRSSYSKINNPSMLNEINRCKSSKSDYLDFSNMELTEIAKETFKDASQIKTLFLYGNRLTTLPESISSLVNLERLFLQDNNFSFDKTFTSLDGLTKINVIDLRRNSIKGDLPAFLTKQKQLRQLLLCSNKIMKIPREIQSLTMLKIFTMTRNQLELLPSDIFPLPEMTLLDLSHNAITELPDSLCSCLALENLHLINNNLTKLPDQIGKLKELKSLRTGNNKIRFLPKSLAECSKLEVLEVENNKLETLPEGLFIKMNVLSNLLLSYNQFSKLELVGDPMLENLRNLNIKNNELDEIPPAFFKAKNLVSVNLSDNRIPQITPSIVEWTHLRELDICSNQLKTIPEAISQLSKLEILKLKFNQIIKLPRAIGGLTALKNLDLESNSIDVLPDSIGDLKNLCELNVSMNNLTELPSTIGGLTNLLVLKASENNLQSLPIELGSLTNIRDLLISDNLELKNLPAELSLCSSLIVLNLERCPLSELPEPIVAGGSAMIIYFLQQVMQLRKKQNLQQNSSVAN